ncbi:MAG: hypothetical protein A3J79_01780 [Elusimicrobia bacterium RIFOXYB2_FULL_62_6]|nr:MAG: hypothetical protein A3J79_01780 [Elusimicrobia bacterium RIFOXYB2_FULL_62_6]
MTIKPEPLAVSRARREDIVYMILIDRFHRGGQPADGPAPPFHGGNLAGIREKLDYLQDLGVTALWLSPVYKNQPDGCHGYWPVDFYAVDPRFGTMEELVSLVNDCHRRGMKVLLDKIFNHAGYAHPMAADPKYKKWFHTDWDIRWVDQKKLELGSLHGLPDFAHENPEVSRYLIDMALWWIEQTGVDGFRLDAVKHVPIRFWKQFSEEVHRRAGPDFLLLGEVFRGIPGYLARYQGKDRLDSVFDVPFADTARCCLVRDCEEHAPNIFHRLNELRKEYRTMLYNEVLRKLFDRHPSDMRRFSELLRSDKVYKDAELLAPIIDNHDLARFISEAGGSEERLRLALTVLVTWRGIPVITYGTECGLGGRTEGSNRAPMPFGENPGLHAFTRKLIEFRKTTPALTRGAMTEILADRQVFAWLRAAGDSKVLVAVNNSRDPQERSLQLPASVKPGGAWTDLFGQERFKMDGAELNLKLKPRSAVVLSLN